MALVYYMVFSSSHCIAIGIWSMLVVPIVLAGGCSGRSSSNNVSVPAAHLGSRPRASEFSCASPSVNPLAGPAHLDRSVTASQGRRRVSHFLVAFALVSSGSCSSSSSASSKLCTSSGNRSSISYRATSRPLAAEAAAVFAASPAVVVVVGIVVLIASC